MAEKKCLEMHDVIRMVRSGKSLLDIAKTLDVSRPTLYAKLKKWGITRKSITFNEDFFNQIDSQEKAYWLGYIMADGCVSMTHAPKVLVVAAKKDVSQLLSWHNAIHSSVKLHRRNDGAFQSQHYSIKMCNDLISHGCVPRKSLKLEFPTTVPKHLLNHFVRGYFDGDGCATVANKKQKTPQLRISFVGTKNFLSSLAKILETNNKLHPTGKKKIARQLQITGNKKAGQVVRWMYEDAEMYLKRKREVCYSTIRL